MNTIGTTTTTTMLPRSTNNNNYDDEGGRDSADNESNFESASFYLGRNLSREMAEIGQQQQRRHGKEDVVYDDDDDVDDGNEIPVWVRGEARWIAGVSVHTTAADLVEALLLDDRSLYDSSQSTTTAGELLLPPPAILQQFVITERWRQMEQILEPNTKVWKIWQAWGEAQCEVRLRLRKIDHNGPMASTTTTSTTTSKKQTIAQGGQQEDTAVAAATKTTTAQLLYDSGRESPTGSAIVRRRRHRASKSTAAWLTQAQTVHPKSSKSSTIEKLMSLILEQGETIQQQLSRLRDREIQIGQLEEQKHRIREQEHGKNYLLETYLNGLHEAEEKDLTTINSDSGVNTEDTQSPNGGTSPLVCGGGDSEEKIIPSITNAKTPLEGNFANVFEYTDREAELLRDHEQMKNLKLKPSKSSGSRSTKDKNGKGGKHQAAATAATKKTKHPANVIRGDEDLKEELDEEEELSEKERQEMEEKIRVLEKIYVINKHLQKEEELLVRLNAKIKRYESENPNLKEDEILDTLHRLNSEIEQRNREIEITNREIELSDELLNKKSAFLNELSAELGKGFDNDHGDDGAIAQIGDTHNNSHSHSCPDDGAVVVGDNLNCFDVNPENIYNISKILLKYSDGVGAAATPEMDRDRHNDRINIATTTPMVNKTDNNKRIIIGNHHSGRMAQPDASAMMGANSHRSTTVTTQVQIHKQPPPASLLMVGHHQQPLLVNSSDSGDIDYPPHSTGNHCHQNRRRYDPLTTGGLPQYGYEYSPNLYSPPTTGPPPVAADPLLGITTTTRTPTDGSDFITPVDLIASSADMLQKCENKYEISLASQQQSQHSNNNFIQGVPPPLADNDGLCNKVVAINSARNISTLMDNKKLAHKNFILTSKAYEGLSSSSSPLFGVPQQQHQQQLPRCPQTDMTQLGTLV